MSNPTISNTRFKLNETSHFLEQMKNTADKPEDFLFNLSAFLSAARSVIDVMDFEFQHNPGFRTWFDREKQVLWAMGFRELKNLRVMVVHHEGNLSTKVTDDRRGFVTMISGNTTFSTTNTTRYFNLPIGWVDAKWVWNFQGTDQPVIHVCERYLGLLSRMVEDCERQFQW